LKKLLGGIFSNINLILYILIFKFYSKKISFE